MKTRTAILTAATLIGLSTASTAQNNANGNSTSGTTQSQGTVPDYGRSGNNTLPPAGAPDTMKPGSDDTSPQPNNNAASTTHRRHAHHSKTMPSNSMPGQDSGSTTTPDSSPH